MIQRLLLHRICLDSSCFQDFSGLRRHQGGLGGLTKNLENCPDLERERKIDQGVFGVRGQDGKVQTRPETLTNDVLVGVTWTLANESFRIPTAYGPSNSLSFGVLDLRII